MKRKSRNDDDGVNVAGLRVFCLLLGLLLAGSAHGQGIAGRWATYGKEMGNGHREQAIIALNQNGSVITGTFESLTGKTNVHGTIADNHFEIFAWDRKTPALIGELVNGELHGTMFGAAFIAKPATPQDEIPKVEYIAPSPLHRVPYNGLAATPPMGWNSWNHFGEDVNEVDIRAAADAMVWSGMRDAGYDYVNIDGTWEGSRDSAGHLLPNKKFKDLKALAGYIHSKGLKVGIYSSPGPYDCAGYPTSYGHEQQDAADFAALGFDYLKYDWCSAEKIYRDDQMRAVYQKMGDALEATGRPMVYSLCQYGKQDVEKWGADVGGNLWRTTDDIRDNWGSMIANVEKQASFAPLAGPGHWNDPDMLEIGNGGMNGDEYRTQMSLWSLVAAPLLAGNDLSTMSDETRSILLNKEVIAIDQDPLGKQATPDRKGDLETWIKPLADGGAAVGIVNLGSSAATATIRASDLAIASPVTNARDLWTHENVKFRGGAYSAIVQPHATLLLRVSVKADTKP
ncbi:MAG: glycoside hydrolase family 27 protein [Terracidiphilus sp.]|jgi:alpha-galactosidase